MKCSHWLISTLSKNHNQGPICGWRKEQCHYSSMQCFIIKFLPSFSRTLTSPTLVTLLPSTGQVLRKKKKKSIKFSRKKKAVWSSGVAFINMGFWDGHNPPESQCKSCISVYFSNHKLLWQSQKGSTRPRKQPKELPSIGYGRKGEGRNLGVSGSSVELQCGNRRHCLLSS